MSEQDEVVRALSEPSFYPGRPASVAHHQTHISHVFVAGPFAYKLKKAVRFSFADFSTAERRRAMCEEEVRLNRRLCAPLYLGVRTVTRGRDGALALDGDGTPVDTLVWMRTLPAEGMLARALERGRVGPEAMAAFARTLARFHAADATALDDAALGAPETLRARWQQVLADTAPMAGTLLSAADLAVLADFGPGFVQRHESWLRARMAAGRVRDGHGDLHGGNLCLVEEALPALAGAPEVPAGLYAFDCLEFSPELRACDVASEVAFLAMDLVVRGHADLAAAFVDAYVEATGDAELRSLLPFYGCHRASVRGMVLGLAARDAARDERPALAERARRHFAHATHLAWGAAGPALVLCSGLSGSGKTTLAVALAAHTGFGLLSSDAVRKERAGLDPHAPAPESRTAELYGDAARHAVYEALAAGAERSLRAGDAVILDATFQRRAERAPLAALARELGVPYLIVACAADEATVKQRLEARAARPEVAAGQPALSDAGFAVYLEQRAHAEPPGGDEPVLRIDTSPPAGDVQEHALRELWAWRRTAPARAPLRLDA